MTSPIEPFTVPKSTQPVVKRIPLLDHVLSILQGEDKYTCVRDSAVAKILHDQTAVAEHVHHVANVDLADLRDKRKCEYQLSL